MIPSPGWSIAWTFIKRFWPFVIILVLVFVVLYQRSTVERAKEAAEQAVTELTEVSRVNDSNERRLRATEVANQQNSKIMLDLLEHQRLNGVRSDGATTIIREAIKNDKVTRDWADMPLPDSVRRALNPTEPGSTN